MPKKKSKSDKNTIEIQINTIKDSYEVLRKKYSLPDFKTLNEEFDIGKLEFNQQTLLRDVRKGIISKFFSILSFIELLINPSNGSMFYMYLVRGLDNVDKENLKALFDKIGEVEIDSFKLDVKYSEAEEARFIKEKTIEWEKEIKPVLSETIVRLGVNWKKISTKKEKSYFG
ncbi:MAG: hypothetical protein AABX03_01800 [Nanoarchaeota archaeon]